MQNVSLMGKKNLFQQAFFNTIIKGKLQRKIANGC